jgi:hypothetical protein
MRRLTIVLLVVTGLVFLIASCASASTVTTVQGAVTIASPGSTASSLSTNVAVTVYDALGKDREKAEELLTEVAAGDETGLAQAARVPEEWKSARQEG